MRDINHRFRASPLNRGKLVPAQSGPCLLFLLALSLVINLSAVAEGSAVEGLSADVPPIPGAGDNDPVLLLNSKNAALFHELLLAPIAAWLKDGKFASRVVRDLNFPWSYAPAHVLSSRSNASILDLGADGTIVQRGSGEIRPGLPFGTQTEIDRESDPRRKALKILWNSALASLPNADTLYAFDLNWFGTEGVKRRASASYFATQRALPGLFSSGLASAGTPPQTIRQELIQFSAPPAVFGAATLSWRYFGTTPDSVWVYSPVLEKSRAVFPANRGDPLLGSSLNPEDLLVLSLKNESIIARVVDDRTMLVSFPQLGMGDLLPDGVESAASKGALTARGAFHGREGQSAFLQFNGETRQFGDIPAWVPATAVMVPRRVWIIELSSNDPFSLSGRSVVVIDKESMLPVYKIVYDRGGSYLRTVIGGWSLVTSDQERIPVLAYLLSIDRKASAVSALSTSVFRIFTDQSNELCARFRRLLNISEHEKQGATGPTPAGSPAVDAAATPVVVPE